MVFDCFTFFNELDLLELRLKILSPHVDKFILVESCETFTGKDKPLYYEENKERFSEWNDKIIHIIAPYVETDLPFERHWVCYELIENKLLELGGPEDIAYCSDLDEIWKPQEVDDNIHSLAQYNYCYYLNMRSSEQWIGTLVSKIKNIYPGYNKKYRTVKPNLLGDGGWHFTNMGGVEQIKKKVEAYDHGHEIPQEWFKENIADFFGKQDFLGRKLDYEGLPYSFWISEKEWPEYLKENREEWKFLCKS